MEESARYEKKFWALSRLIKAAGLSAVRKRFNKILPPEELARILNSKGNVIQSLVSKKVISIQELDILQRIPGVNLSYICPASGKKGIAFCFTSRSMTFLLSKRVASVIQDR
jgi:hypothetical protein